MWTQYLISCRCNLTGGSSTFNQDNFTGYRGLCYDLSQYFLKHIDAIWLQCTLLGYNSAEFILDNTIPIHSRVSQGVAFQIAYKVFDIRALKISNFTRTLAFNEGAGCFCWLSHVPLEIQQHPLQFHTKHLTSSSIDRHFIQGPSVTSSWI